MRHERSMTGYAALAILLNCFCGAGCGSSPDSPPPEVPQVPVELPAAPAAPPAEAQPAAPPKARDAASYTFDGFKLGTLFGSEVMSRPPYHQPCDNDPIDKNARRFMVYGAKPCRDRTFPEDTTVVFYIKYTDNRDDYNQPIEAFGWLGGNYFASRSDFPVRTGEPANAVNQALGAPLKTFPLERKKASVTVQQHPGNVWSVVEDGMAVGFVVGPMPEDPESEQWRGLMQMFERYTKAQ
ncbi:MAG: hypothetical protein HUU21_04250 [Polyangiaceae bacterium]|nr:hypothetical protein [Polyangiaceae bacterium]